jgi:hypothetical protein
MRTQAKTLLIIFVALVIVLVTMHKSLALKGMNMPPVLSQIPYGPSTSPVLDGNLMGYDLKKLSMTIDRPCPEWHTPFLLAGWSEEEWATARWIIYRESRCLQDAFNGVDAGLLQINEFHHPLIESFGLRFPDDMFDGETNLWVALTLWQQYGWEPWIYKGVIPGAD